MPPPTTTSCRRRSHLNTILSGPDSSPRDAIRPNRGRRGRCQRIYPYRCRNGAAPCRAGPATAPTALTARTARTAALTAPTLTSTGSSRGRIRPILGRASPADRSARPAPTRSGQSRPRWPGSATAPDLWWWIHHRPSPPRQQQQQQQEEEPPLVSEGQEEGLGGGEQATPPSPVGAALATAGVVSTTTIGGPAWRVRRRPPA